MRKRRSFSAGKYRYVNKCVPADPKKYYDPSFTDKKLITLIACTSSARKLRWEHAQAKNAKYMPKIWELSEENKAKAKHALNGAFLAIAGVVAKRINLNKEWRRFATSLFPEVYLSMYGYGGSGWLAWLSFRLYSWEHVFKWNLEQIKSSVIKSIDSVIKECYNKMMFKLTANYKLEHDYMEGLKENIIAKNTYCRPERMAELQAERELIVDKLLITPDENRVSQEVYTKYLKLYFLSVFKMPHTITSNSDIETFRKDFVVYNIRRILKNSHISIEDLEHPFRGKVYPSLRCIILSKLGFTNVSEIE